MNTDLSLISRQLRREIEQGEVKRKHLTDTTRNAEEKRYASSTVYGQQMLKGATASMAEHMRSSLKNLGRGAGCVDGATVYKHLKAADPEILAVLALKVCLDVLSQEDKPTLLQLSAPIGAAIEIEQRLAWYRSKDKDLFTRITRSFHNSTGTRQKATVFKLRFNEAGLEWTPWGVTTHHKVGAWALRSLIETTGWVEKKLIQKKTTKRQTVMSFSQEFLGLRDSIMARAMDLAYCLWPMLCPPNEWSNEERGGYLTEEIRGTSPMIRRTGFGGTSMQGDVPIAFLNRLQAQKYKINVPLCDVADWCYQNRREVGKLRISEPRTRLDPFIGDTELEPDRFKDWKRQQRQIDDFNAQLHQYNWRATETMFVARMYRDEECFWIPWSYDYRSRVYPLNTTLNPQGTDFDKALLYFADEGPVNEYWLAWHCATCFGHDKISHDDRAAWARENVSLISSVATDPLGTILEWEQASEPWCFLAACLEYHACCIEATKQTSGLPIGVDATASGIQHLASMTRDLTAGREVNLVRGKEDKPSDGYKTVAEASIKYIDDPEIHPFIDRKVTKRTCMTKPYGCSRDSSRTYIREALDDAGFDLTIPKRLGKVVDAVYRKAMPEVFKGPCEVMDWLQASAKTLLETRETIEWVTPSGFHVVQDIRHPKTKRIKTQLMGQVSVVTVGDGFGGVDHASHKGAIAPNLVHSLDASLLHLTFAYWEKPFTCIHDCILGRSCDMTEMMHDIRLHHAEMYKGGPLEDWAEQLGLEIPDGLIVDDLDIDLVLDSPYYFC
jgi:DNA-directed RNA polymerase